MLEINSETKKIKPFQNMYTAVTHQNKTIHTSTKHYLVNNGMDIAFYWHTTYQTHIKYNDDLTDMFSLKDSVLLAVLRKDIADS